MPILNGVGYSTYTQQKMEIFSSLLRQIFSIYKRIEGKKQWPGCSGWPGRFFYYDMTAGIGINPNGVIGSPLVFLQTAITYNMENFNLHLYEREKVNIDILQENMSLNTESHETYNVHYHNIDHHEIKLENNNNDFGILFYDLSGNMPDFELLQNIAVKKKSQKIDFIIYTATTTYKRCRKSPKHKQTIPICDCFKNINKKHWLISEPQGFQGWTFFVGSNYPLRSKYALRLADINSKEGKSWLNWATWTKEERAKQNNQYLFPLH